MFNCFTNGPLVKGIAIGVGASALGFCLYKACLLYTSRCV